MLESSVLLKRDSNTGAFLWFFHEHLFWRTPVHSCFWHNIGLKINFSFDVFLTKCEKTTGVCGFFYIKDALRLSMISKTSKKVYEVMFSDRWKYVFWKYIQCTIHWDKTEMFKKFPSDKINGTKNALFFFRDLQLNTVLLLICGSYMRLLFLFLVLLIFVLCHLWWMIFFIWPFALAT